MSRRSVSVEEVREAGVLVPVVKAGEFIYLGRTATYQAVDEGTFPVPVLRIGKRLMVRRSDILQYLGIEDRPGLDVETGGLHAIA